MSEMWWCTSENNKDAWILSKPPKQCIKTPSKLKSGTKRSPLRKRDVKNSAKHEEYKENNTVSDFWDHSESAKQSVWTENVGDNIYSVDEYQLTRSLATPIKQSLFHSLTKSPMIALMSSARQTNSCKFDNSKSGAKRQRCSNSSRVKSVERVPSFREDNNDWEVERLNKRIQELEIEHDNKDKAIWQLVDALDKLTDGQFSKQI